METHIIKTWRRAISAVIALTGAFTLAAGGNTQTPTDAVAVMSFATTATDAAVGEDADDVPATAVGTPKEGDVRGHRRILIVTYHVVKDCTVHANYPINPGDHTWVIRRTQQSPGGST